MARTSSMKLIVTGGAGFIGSAVVRQAVAQGHEVVNLDALTYAACLDNLAPVADAPNYTFVQADIRDRAAMDAVFAEHTPDAVMHLAAESHVDRSIDGPGAFVEQSRGHIGAALAALRVEHGAVPEDRLERQDWDAVLLDLCSQVCINTATQVLRRRRVPHGRDREGCDAR